MSLEEKINQFIKDAINKQFEIAEHKVKFEDVLGDENDGWYSKYTITPEQTKEFESWWKQEAKKRKLGINQRLDKEFGWFMLNYGLKTKKEIKKPITINEDILFYAFRYALGRKTYVVSDVINSITDNWNNLSDSFKKAVKEEIKEAIKNNRAGDKNIDVPKWNTILKLK